MNKITPQNLMPEEKPQVMRFTILYYGFTAHFSQKISYSVKSKSGVQVQYHFNESVRFQKKVLPHFIAILAYTKFNGL
jgi:hypothetical protein